MEKTTTLLNIDNAVELSLFTYSSVGLVNKLYGPSVTYCVVSHIWH